MTDRAVGAADDHASVGGGPDGAADRDDARPEAAVPTGATRRDLQLGRRLAHLANGVAIATAYALFFSHTQVVRVFGTIACLVYVADRIRILYPELALRLPGVNAAFFRAEEQFRESAMTPYVISILLTILTFPKTIALVAILTLAIADPASAVVGIRFGRHRVVPDKSLEGSAAFFAATFAIALGLLRTAPGVDGWQAAGAAGLVALAAAAFEMLPLRLDDNLTIPLLVGFAAWAVCLAVGIEVA